LKSIRLDITYPKRELSGEKPMLPEQVSLNVILVSVSLSFPGGQGGRYMGNPERRMWAKIQDRITDDDGKPVCGEVELSDEQFDFLRKTVKDTAMPPGYATAAVVFEDHLDEVQTRWQAEHK
jgi:hypothetical protein